MSSFFIWIIGDILKPTGLENYKKKKTSFSTEITESEGIPVTGFFAELSKQQTPLETIWKSWSWDLHLFWCKLLNSHQQVVI